MKDSKALALGVLALIGWGLLVVLIVAPPDWAQRMFSRKVTSRSEVQLSQQVPSKDSYVPAILSLKDLASLNIDATRIQQIAPHVLVLDAALRSLVDLHAQYDATTLSSIREDLQRRAHVFHVTADLHEEQIEKMLTSDEADQFHRFMRSVERSSGIPDDPKWHLHNMRGHRDELEGIRHDSLERIRGR